MPICNVTFFSESLQKQSAMSIILPEPKLKPPYPVLIQLHGLSDDHSAWMRWSSIERHCDSEPFVVVMPDGGRGWYTDAVDGPAYESHIIKDTLGFVERYFPVKKTREGRSIGGLSMGGYGAMKLALKYPKIFGSVAAHSSAFGRGREEVKGDQREVERVFGRNPRGGENDVFALAEKISKKDMPAIRFDCGKKDFLIESNRAFHRHLAKLGIKHVYREYPGAHEWKYWDNHFPEALRFHLRSLGLQGK